MSAKKVPARQDAHERRRWSRYVATSGFPAELVTADGRIACRIENVSLAGAKLHLAQPVRPKGRVSLDHGCERGPDGRTIWANGDSLGVRFEFSERAVGLALACIHGDFPKTAKPDQPG